MLLLLLKISGWLTAHAPELLLRAISAIFGDFIFFVLRRRRRAILSNLHHAFPGNSAAWHRAIGRESCHRLVETGLLSLATPFLGERRYREILSASPELKQCFVLHHANPAPTLICSAHIAYWEVQTSMPLVVPSPFPEFGTIFRPLKNSAMNDFVQRSRERFGMKLLSRKEGFGEALKILRRRGFVGLLFDQNAGMQGALTTLFGRVCSTTELPGLMAEKFHARVYGIFPRRRAFWRVEIDVQPIAHDNTSDSVTIALNRWLEDLLRHDDNLCASWLWAHNRWRHQDVPEKRLRLESRRNLLAADLRIRKIPALPRRTRIFIRLPNWLGDVVMAVPLLRALRISRPDAEIVLLARPQFLPLLQAWQIADRLHALPARGPGYFLHFHRLRHEFPDTWLLFTNSFRGDLEARLASAPQRFGIVRPGRRRPLLSHGYRVPAGFDESRHHQFELWENFFRHFGLEGPIDRTPLPAFDAPRSTAGTIGLIPGSENTPEKRWPVPHWRALIAAFPAETFTVFGTPNDASIAAAVAEGFDSARVTNLAGKTDLPSFAAQLASCRALVTNDTGGMHLANALGVPLLALFGPTNPLRTGPIFSGPTAILQPPHCPDTGGASLATLTPDAVSTELRHLLTRPVLSP